MKKTNAMSGAWSSGADIESSGAGFSSGADLAGEEKTALLDADETKGGGGDDEKKTKDGGGGGDGGDGDGGDGDGDGDGDGGGGDGEDEKEEDFEVPPGCGTPYHKMDKHEIHRRWVMVVFMGPLVPSFLSLVTIIVGSVTLNPVAMRPWRKKYSASPCDRENALLMFMWNQIILSYVVIFTYMMSLMGPCNCSTLRPLLVSYGLIGVWACVFGFIGTWAVTSSIECKAEVPSLYNAASMSVAFFWVGLIIALYYYLEFKFQMKFGPKLEARRKARAGADAKSLTGSAADDELMRKQVHAQFKKFDPDDSDTMDASEVGSLVASIMGGPMPEEDLAAAVAEMDEDGEGSVSWAEFEAWFFKEDDAAKKAAEEAKAEKDKKKSEAKAARKAKLKEAKKAKEAKAKADQEKHEAEFPVWSEVYDPGSEAYYYYNNNTGETTWDKPADYKPPTKQEKADAKSGKIKLPEPLIKLNATRKMQGVWRAKKARESVRTLRAEKKAAEAAAGGGEPPKWVESYDANSGF